MIDPAHAQIKSITVQGVAGYSHSSFNAERSFKLLSLQARLILIAIIYIISSECIGAEAPARDVKGSKDNPIVSRFAGSVIIGYRKQDYASLTLPLGPYEERQSRKFSKSKIIEGGLTSIFYAIPEGKSALEVYRNYQRILTAAGFHLAYECERELCGGYNFAAAIADPVNEDIGGELFNLRINLIDATNGNIQALTAHLDRAEGAVDVSLLVSQDDGKQPAVLIQIVDGRAMQSDQVTVDARAMSDRLDKAGHIALYGIQFENDSAKLKTEADKTLSQMAEMLARDTKRKVYIVGHTDNVGTLEHNVELSQARANAVVKVLSAKFGIDVNRLQSRGIGPFAPVASNANEAGRAKNRRVELVER